MRRVKPGPAWTRREVLGALAATAGLPAVSRGSGPRRRVGIIGGGMAGVALTWLLDGERDVVLLEARDSIGGNVQSVEVELDGQTTWWTWVRSSSIRGPIQRTSSC